MSEGFFLVTCFGNSASKWLAKALHSHPEIACSHGPQPAELGLIFDRELTQDERGRVNALQNEYRTGRVERFFEELMANSSARFLGNVHGHRCISLLAAINSKLCEVKLNCLNLIRHPVSWVASGQANYTRQSGQGLLLRHELLNVAAARHEHYLACCQRHGVDALSWENLAFYAAAFYQGGLVQDMRVAQQLKVPHVKMEEVTRDPEVLRDVVAFLSDGALVPDAAYLQAVIGGGPINAHRQQRGNTPQEEYSLWSPWQREVYRYFAQESDIIPMYREQGYDFAFVNGA